MNYQVFIKSFYEHMEDRVFVCACLCVCMHVYVLMCLGSSVGADAAFSPGLLLYGLTGGNVAVPILALICSQS